jgi:hypothetical protein
MLPITTRLSAFLLLATIALAQQAPTAEPLLPVIDSNACPFEGCTFRAWKVTKESTLYSSWKSKRTEIGKLHPGQDVTGLTGVHITYKPDRILVKQPLPDLGLRPGDVILRYMYVGEGFANVWFKGEWHREFDCSFITEKNGQGCLKDCAAMVTEEGKKEWWVKIKTASGKIGWVLVDNNFDGMDILAERG